MTVVPPTCSALSLSLHLLLAPKGQLSADGQLGELIRERRSRRGGDGGILYLTPGLLAAQQLASAEQEAVAARDPAVITWLQLRFGGRRQSWQLDVAALPQGSLELPPPVALPW